MRLFLCASLALSFLPCVVFSQTVTLRNVSAPNTRLEVGNTVEVKIAGAQSFGTVTLAQNGFPPVTMGQTDASGNWSISAVETIQHVGIYNQTWAVNGIAMTPLNPNPTYLPKAPRLPVFTVYSNYFWSNCAQPSTLATGCFDPSATARRWGWNPVVVKKHSSSSISISAISTAVSQWNGVQSRIQYSYSPFSPRIDVLVFDGYANGDNAVTYTYGQDCQPCPGCPSCVGYTNTCTGACTTIDHVFFSDIYLDMNTIATAASFLGISTSAAAEYTLRHEMGHSLSSPWWKSRGPHSERRGVQCEAA